MKKLPRLKSSEVVKALKKAGFIEKRITGSHMRLAHSNGRKVTVPIHGKDVPIGTLKSVLRQTQLSNDEFLDYF
ncbi:MAG: type II toxin-antitoxin system HicA family toxin [bacterium]